MTKQPAVVRSHGVRILRISLLIGAAGVAPLLLYILLGPANGNPIGLCLLAVVAVPASIVGMAIGALTLVVERFARRKA
jgi:dolichol kinase